MNVYLNYQQQISRHYFREGYYFLKSDRKCEYEGKVKEIKLNYDKKDLFRGK